MSQRTVDAVAIHTPHAAWFRFSIQGLLVATTLIAAALGVTNWSVWDQDEKWILSSWICGALALGIPDRIRGRLGIVAAAVGGGLAPAAVVLHLWQNSSRYPMAHAWWLAELGHSAVLLTLAAGAIAAAAVAALCCLARWRPWWVVGVALIAVIALVEIRPRVWMERVAFKVIINENRALSYAPTPTLALDCDGTRLVIERRAPTNQSFLEIWSIGDRPVRMASAEVKGLHNFNRAEFAPEGSQLAVGYSFGKLIAIIDSRTAAWKSTLQPPARVESLSHFRFTDDGSALVALGSLPYHQTVLAWDAKTHELLCQIAIPRPIPRVVSAAGSSSLVIDQAWAREQELAAERAWEPRSESDHRWLALSRELLSLDGGRQPPISLPPLDEIVAQCDDWTVVAHRQPMPSHWLQRCPFVRRFYRRDALNQLMLVESVSGKVIHTSGWIPEISATAISRDGCTIATVTADGKVRIWDVPE
jgi:hypothetical protein